MNFPSHHQGAFFSALRTAGVDLHVAYYGAITADRLALGWGTQEQESSASIKVSGFRSALAVLREYKDAVHIIPGYGGRIPSFVAIVASWSHIPWVHWSEPAHPGMRWWIDWPRKWLYAKLVNRRALGALAIGANAESDFLRWGMDRRKIRQLPYSRAQVRQVVRVQRSTRITFGFVGALCRRKGVDALISAFGQIVRMAPQARLLLVGRNDFGSELDRMILECAAGSRIEIHSAVAADDVLRYLEEIDVFVMASRFDGWGVALQEAALAGCALISTRTCGAAQHLVRHEQNGMLLTNCNAAAIFQAMEAYAAIPGLAAKHGALSPAIAADFLPEENARRLARALAGFRSST